MVKLHHARKKIPASRLILYLLILALILLFIFNLGTLQEWVEKLFAG